MRKVIKLAMVMTVLLMAGVLFPRVSCAESVRYGEKPPEEGVYLKRGGVTMHSEKPEAILYWILGGEEYDSSATEDFIWFDGQERKIAAKDLDSIIKKYKKDKNKEKSLIKKIFTNDYPRERISTAEYTFDSLPTSSHRKPLTAWEKFKAVTFFPIIYYGGIDFLGWGADGGDPSFRGNEEERMWKKSLFYSRSPETQKKYFRSHYLYPEQKDEVRQSIVKCVIEEMAKKESENINSKPDKVDEKSAFFESESNQNIAEDVIGISNNRPNATKLPSAEELLSKAHQKENITDKDLENVSRSEWSIEEWTSED